MNFSKIKMMFFDFDDTLLIHYREQRLDSTGEAHRERLLRRQVETKDGYRVFDEIGEPNELIKQFLAEHPDRHADVRQSLQYSSVSNSLCGRLLQGSRRSRRCRLLCHVHYGTHAAPAR